MVLRSRQVGPLIQYTYSQKVPGAAIQSSEVNLFRLENTLIDAGSEPCAPLLLDEIGDDPPDSILLTHQHEDHVGGGDEDRAERPDLAQDSGPGRCGCVEADRGEAVEVRKHEGLAENTDEQDESHGLGGRSEINQLARLRRERRRGSAV